ncbi:helix-turn-helix transcriptional regulator [Kribbella qitaiheensis]|uniref:Helix-turn-helix transcriptional regulator n=1 Tax=Kribbella qitaiheensis TaxID=1544730 RepID=A0A7G6WZK9_9ACTN|nr:helix-turn-helix domain-containing protein [Kribbella qitaiheensis]QNE19424.1 helix-turn-helix transcriptional regulator [Kribbella qitaiheensis]
MNDRLRTAMSQRGLSVQALAEACAVDPKTVERWLSKSRVPHRQYRWVAANLLGSDETYLWPAIVDQQQHRRKVESISELVRLYPNRAAMSLQAWQTLINESAEAIDVLVYSGTFFSQMPNISRILEARCRMGVRIRICFGDPGCDAVARRDEEEGLEGTLSSKIRAARTYFRSIMSVEGCEVRLHQTTLYNSIFRFDDNLLANPHVWGHPASMNPLLHFRRVDPTTAGLFDHYRDSFEAVWGSAAPWAPISGRIQDAAN